MVLEHRLEVRVARERVARAHRFPKQTKTTTIILSIIVPIVKNTSSIYNLPDTVHTELRRAHIHSQDSRQRGDDGPNGAATGRVRPDTELLHWQPRDSTNAAEECGRDTVGGVSLIGVVLDDQPAVDLGRHVGVVLALVVGVNGVGHVDGHHHAVPQRAHKSTCTTHSTIDIISNRP